MFISRELKKTNTAEYLLYMWQVEDLLRAYDCSLTRLKREYISRFNYSDEQKEELADWYGSLISMMNSEGCRESGHLSINRRVMQEMEERNRRLQTEAGHEEYKAQYYRVLPFIVELRRKNGGQGGEMETCLGALYGTMMLRLQKKEISPDTEHAIQEITTLVKIMMNET